MKKDGFISMTLVYSFLIIFLLVMLSLAASYLEKDKLVKIIVEDVKKELIVRE